MSAPRCKPGDLAIVTRAFSTPEMLGRIVIVDRLYKSGDDCGGKVWDSEALGRLGLCWVVRPASGGSLPARSAFGHYFELPERPYPDFALRPIRPDEGEDESLSWSRPRVEEIA